MVSKEQYLKEKRQEFRRKIYSKSREGYNVRAIDAKRFIDDDAIPHKTLEKITNDFDSLSLAYLIGIYDRWDTKEVELFVEQYNPDNYKKCSNDKERFLELVTLAIKASAEAIRPEYLAGLESDSKMDKVA